MALWSDEDFQRVAVTTKLSSRTLAACRDVLVNGLSGVDSGAKHGLLTPQISRALKQLKTLQSELTASVDLMQDSKIALHDYAVKEAKAAAIGAAVVRDAEPGREYEGPTFLRTPGFIIQKVGRDLVIHDLGKLDCVPGANVNLSIRYPEDGKLASVKIKVQEKNIPGVER
jgi:hypothetical protein